MTISKDMPIGEILQCHPRMLRVFLNHGLMCVGCGLARFESVEQGALAHGIDVDELVKDLNAVLEEQPTE